MTIIEPNKNKFKLKFLILFVMGWILVEAVLSIFTYNQSVQLNHALNINRKTLENMEVRNADLKNQLYSILDFQNAEQLAEKLGLVKERKPEYLARH